MSDEPVSDNPNRVVLGRRQRHAMTSFVYDLPVLKELLACYEDGDFPIDND